MGEKIIKTTNTAHPGKKDQAKSIEIRASLRFLHTGPRKVRLITNFVTGMDVLSALQQLYFLQKRAKEPLVKLINSAVANAINNFGLKKENLYIKSFIVNQGPTLKRWKPKAYGRAGKIRKRTSHVELVLAERVASDKEMKKRLETQAKDEIKLVSPEDVKKKMTYIDNKDVARDIKKVVKKGFTKKLFSRKTG